MSGCWGRNGTKDKVLKAYSGGRNNMARMKFMNTEIDNLTMAEALEAIDQLIQENKSAYVVTPNVDHIVQLETNTELQDVYKNASLILTDGKPLLWIAKWYGTPIKEKISGSDLFPLLCEMAAKKGYKFYRSLRLASAFLSIPSASASAFKRIASASASPTARIPSASR